MTDTRTFNENGLLFYPYTTRFLMEGPQVEVTVAVSPIVLEGETSATAYIELDGARQHERMNFSLEVDELMAFGQALVACSKAADLRPDEIAEFFAKQTMNRNTKGADR